MGRDKAQLRLGGATILGRIKQTAAQLRLPVRVVRKDLVPRCGPLGGIFTALKRTEADAVLFLSCDMPFITTALLIELIREFELRHTAVFVSAAGQVGFPFLLPAPTLLAIEELLDQKSYALQTLARRIRARKWKARHRRHELMNINTPDDLARARNRGDGPSAIGDS